DDDVLTEQTGRCEGRPGTAGPFGVRLVRDVVPPEVTVPARPGIRVCRVRRVLGPGRRLVHPPDRQRPRAVWQDAVVEDELAEPAVVPERRAEVTGAGVRAAR